MRARATASVLLTVLGGALAYTVTASGEPTPGGQVTVYVTETVRVPSAYHGHGPEWWANRSAHNRRQRDHANLRLRHAKQTIRRQALDSRRRWAPTLRSAVQLASAVTGVPAADLLHVAYCESTWNPYAVNGRYKGYWQLGWAPFGLSPYDPYAAALSTAMTVRHDGGWRQWECKP